MPLFGEIVVIKRNGTDGTHFPLTANSCLFGRKKECDIRIQLPRVSKEHCKIEVNENKEATLINLSAVNPTLLNGSSLQHPTHLKHKDVLTIIDRSFRFEYPPLSVPRKRNSVSQEKETLQVLHIQQVDQEELLHQNSECKSLQTPDKKLEWEGQNTHGSDKQKAEECITRQYGTPESAHKRRSNTKNEISPFSQLYYLKSRGERQSTKGLSNEISAQKEYLLRKDGHDHLEEVSTRTPRRRSAYKKIEAVIQEEAEQSRKIENQEISRVVCSLVSVEENNSKKSSLNLQAYALEKKLTGEEITERADFQDIKENELEISEVLKSYASLRANTKNAEGFPKSCCIMSLEYSDGAKSKKQPTEATDEKIKSSLTDTFESDENSLSTPKYKGKHIQINSSTHSQEVSKRSSSKSRILPVEDNSLLGIFSPIESSIKTEGSSMYVNREEYASNVFNPNVHFDIKESNALLVTEKPLDPEILKETKDHICDTSDPYKEGNFGIIDCSPYRRSPRRSMKQNKDFVNEDCFKGKLTEKESLETPTSVSPGNDRMRTPSHLSEQTVGKYCPQKTDKKIKEKPAINREQDFVIKSNIQGSSNLTESLKGSIQMPSKEAVSEMTVSSPLNVKREAGVKKFPQKRKNREADLLNQPFGKRKRVSFGSHLSPELFDKRLPPNSPLKRGAIPARLSLPFGNSPRAVLKKASELGQSVSKDFSERKQHENIWPQKVASPPAASPPAASPPAASPPAASPPARRSPAASLPARRSPAASPPARRSPAASPPARRSPAASPPARRSPAASPPARRSPAASPPARRSPAASPPARRSPAASPPARRSPAASPTSSFSCDVPQKRGRFSVSRIISPSSSVEQAAIIGEKHVCEEFTEAKCSVEEAAIIGEKYVHEEFTETKSPEPSEHEFKATRSIRRSKRFSLKRNSLHRRSCAIDAIYSQRQSGASGANLIVAKSWAEVVKQGVPKSQLRISTKCGLTRRSKKTSKQPKSNVPVLKTPARKVKGYFTTGHANSPAPIVIGKACTSIVKITAQAPKVVLNFPVKQHCDLNESLTGLDFANRWHYTIVENVGVSDMFNTPLNWKQKNSMSSVEKTNMSTPEVSALHTAENSETSQLSSLVEDKLKMSPRGENTEEEIEEIVKESGSLGTSVNETLVGVQVTRESEKHKLESEVFSGIQRLMRTPKTKSKPVEALSGFKRLLRTSTEKPEPVEALSGIKMLMRTPMEKPKPVEALSGIKRLMRTPKEKPKPVEALSGVKRLLRTPKEKPEPVEALSGVKRLLRTPKEKPEPVEALSGVKMLMRTPTEKPKHVEALSGVKMLMRTPTEKPKPVEALSGVKRLMRTPKENPKPVEALSGVKRLMRTPKEKPEPVEALSVVMRADSKMELFEDEPVCSIVSETPEEVLGERQGSATKRTPKQRPQPVGISFIIEEHKEKIQPVEDTEGIPRLLRGSKQRSEPVEEIVGISSQLEIPRQFKPVDDYLGLHKFMAEPKQIYFSPEIDYTGVKEMFEIADEYKVKLPESGNLTEDCESHIHSRSELEFSGIVPENEELQQDTKLEDVFEKKSSLVKPKDNYSNDQNTEDGLEDLTVSSLNKFKIRADVESFKTLCVPENTQPVGIDIQNGTTIDSGKTTRQGSPGIMDAELLEPLATTRQTRKGKNDKSNSTEESNTKKTRSRAKSMNCIQTNENSGETVIEPKPEMTKRSTRGKSRQHLAERNTDMESDTKMQTKETSVKIHQSVRRQVAAKGLGQAEAHFNSKETATTEENGTRLITRTSSRARNKKLDKNELKSEFTKINPQDKIQCKDLEHSEIKCGKNDGFKRNTRGKGSDPIQTGFAKDKFGSLEFIAQETSGMASLESNPTKLKENIVRKGKGRRNVHFLLEEHNSVPLVEESVVAGETVAHEEKRSVPPTKRTISRGRKRKASVASLPVCTSPTRKNELTEVGQAEQKEGISLPLEHSTFVKDNSSGSSSFVQEKCSQEIQNKDIKLEDLLERKYLVISKNNCRNDQKAEDSLEDLTVSSLNKFKIEADVKGIETLCVPENTQPVAMDIQNGTTIDSGKTIRQGSPGIMDAELLEPLASTRQTRKGKNDKSNSTEESNTKKTRSRAKSMNCIQTNENSGETVIEPKPEMTKRSTRGKSRQHLAERNTDMESDTKMQTKETSVKIHQSVRRQVAAKGLGQAEAHFSSKETATTEENGTRLITRTSSRARNKKLDKNELKSEFTKINPQDKIQCKDLEHSEIKCDKNDGFKRNTRGKGSDPIQTGYAKDKFGSLEFIAQETSGMASLESNPTKLKENIVQKGKGRRNVHFLLEEHNSVPLVEESVVAGETVAHEEKRSVPPTKRTISRGRKRKASVASLPVCTSPTRKNELTEVGQAEQKEGISLPLEHSTFVKDDSSGSSSFVQEKCSQEIQNKENGTLYVCQTLDNTPAKQQKVIKKKPITRGQSKQAISHETSTENDHQAADIQDQNVAIAIIENVSKRGGRMIAPLSQVSLPLENSHAKEIPSIDNLCFVQAKGSSQRIKNEEIPTEIQNVALKNAQGLVYDSATKRQNVIQDHTVRRGRSKHAISHETSIKYENKESGDTKDQNVVVKNAFSTKENPSKRGRVKKVAPVSQTLFSPLKNDNLPLPSSTNSKSTEEHDKDLENAEFTAASGSLSHRGRRKKMEHIPTASSVSARKRSKLLDNDQEKVPEDLQGVTNDNVYKRGEMSTAGNGQPGNDSKEATPITEKEPLEKSFGKENQPMQSRRKNAPASQIPPSLKVSITLPSAPSDKGETTSEQSMLIRHAVGEEKIINSNGKKVPCSTAARRRRKLPEVICQEKQNEDLEKTAISNERESRRGRRKADVPEATVSISCPEKCGLTVKHGIISKVQHESPKHPQRKAHKGKNLQNMDPSNISNDDQNSNLGLKVLPEKGNSFKHGKQKQVIPEPESSIPTSNMKKTFFTENVSKPTAGSTESTALQRGKRKMKEYQTAVASVEMENKTRGSRRTRK